MTVRVGITGGMGSGKSIAAKVFELLGIPVYYADEAAKRLMNEDNSLKKQLKKQFGTETYVDGKINRQYLASLVFNNDEQLKRLNAIVHPVTLADAAHWMQQQTTPYAIKEAALIFESGADKALDVIIGVSAPAPLRMQRVMKRDNLTREEVKARLDKQMNEALKMRLCDHVITNDELELIIPQVLKIHNQILADY